MKDGYNQVKYQYNYSIANKTTTPASGLKGDFMMLSPYYWHPTTIATSSSIGKCANCVRLKAQAAAGTFASWMDTGLISRDERYMPNNQGSFFVATYAHIAVWTQNATLMTNAKYYIGNYTVNNTGAILTYTTNEFALVVSGQIPSFYTQFDSTAQ